jgi:hypothetical protein
MHNDDSLMIKQLTQLFEYAETVVRLNSALEMLDAKDGYCGEGEIIKEIEKVKMNIHKKMKVHLSNSGVSNSAMRLINNMIIVPQCFRTDGEE